MGPLDLIFHLLNFVAPALVVGVLVAWVAPFIYKKRPAAHGRTAQAAINFGVGLVALVAALAFYGHDGKMAAYTALVLAVAASQWWAVRR